MSKKVMKIPFNRATGDMLDYSYIKYKPEEEFTNEQIVWVNPIEFEDNLEYLRHSRGRSKFQTWWKSKNTGRKYPMFASGLDIAIKYVVNGCVKSKFKFVKKGSNFAIEVIEPNS
jgi:hypothetical protein